MHVLPLSFLSGVEGHAMMVVPPPRNAVDKDLAPWNAAPPSSWDHHVDTPICPMADGLDTLSLRNGQACFWFSHGCTIYCDTCDGVTARGGTACGNEGQVKATICDPQLRTINREAECGSKDDFYYYNPWRAPGAAPVFDACGVAGGALEQAGADSAGIRYKNTSHAKQGDTGSEVLPEAPSGTIWTAGELAEVSWTVRANHGGGYQYRLCPKGDALTEACFQRTPLQFEGRSSLRWGGEQGKRLWFDGTYVSEGTVPQNSTWAMNPIPRIDSTKYPKTPGHHQDGFPAPCWDPNAPEEGGYGGLCSGWYGPDNLEIVDTVRVPSLPSGDYVVQFRWDCEESAQVWTNCADVSIDAASAVV